MWINFRYNWFTSYGKSKPYRSYSNFAFVLSAFWSLPHVRRKKWTFPRLSSNILEQVWRKGGTQSKIHVMLDKLFNVVQIFLIFVADIWRCEQFGQNSCCEIKCPFAFYFMHSLKYKNNHLRKKFNEIAVFYFCTNDICSYGAF